MTCELIAGSLCIVVYAVAIAVFIRYQGRKFREELRKLKENL